MRPGGPLMPGRPVAPMDPAGPGAAAQSSRARERGGGSGARANRSAAEPAPPLGPRAFCGGSAAAGGWWRAGRGKATLSAFADAGRMRCRNRDKTLPAHVQFKDNKLPDTDGADTVAIFMPHKSGSSGGGSSSSEKRLILTGGSRASSGSSYTLQASRSIPSIMPRRAHPSHRPRYTRNSWNVGKTGQSSF